MQIVGEGVTGTNEIVRRVQDPIVLTAVDGRSVDDLEPVQGGVTGPLKAELLELLPTVGEILDVEPLLPDGGQLLSKSEEG